MQVPPGEVNVAVLGQAGRSHVGQRQSCQVIGAGTQQFYPRDRGAGDSTAQTHDKHTELPANMRCIKVAIGHRFLIVLVARQHLPQTTPHVGIHLCL